MRFGTKLWAAMAAMALIPAAVMAAPMDKATLKPVPQQVGKVTLTAEILPFDKLVTVDGAFGMPGMALMNGHVYTKMKNGELGAWILNGSTLKADTAAFGGKTVKVEGNDLFACNGKLYADPFFGMNVIDPVKGVVYEGRNNPDRQQLSAKNVAIDPVGKFAIGWWMNNDVVKIDMAKFEGNQKCVTPWAPLTNIKVDGKRTSMLKDIKMISVGKSRIYVGGTVAGEKLKPENKNGTVVGVEVYDYNGKLLGSYSSEDKKMGEGGGMIAWTHGFVETKDGGFAVLDGNFRALFIFDKNINFVGKVDLMKLTSLKYPWPSSIVRLDKDSCLLMTTQEFANPTRYEAVVWKIKGI